MNDEQARHIVEKCKGMSDEEIIAVYHAAYCDDTRPHASASPAIPSGADE